MGWARYYKLRLVEVQETACWFSLTQGKKPHHTKSLLGIKSWWGKTLNNTPSLWFSSNVWASACYFSCQSSPGQSRSSPAPHAYRLQILYWFIAPIRDTFHSRIIGINALHKTGIDIPGSIHPYKVRKINYTCQLLPRVPNCQCQPL